MKGLHADSILKSYGARTILSDVYLGCDVGEIVGLLGRNGCGKSTMLKIIFGVLNAEYRFVRVDDRVQDALSESCKLIKYLPQDSFLPDHIKVKTIISLFCGASDAGILREHPLVKPFLEKKSRELSGGELRVFEILLIIHSSAKYILIDEPFNGVSPIHVKEIKKAIKSQTGTKGFIITDHSYRNILDISDRIVLIHDQAIRQVKNEQELQYWGYTP